MKTRNGNKKIGSCLGILVLCIAVNFGGKLLAESLQLPVWMDMVGTCTAVYYLGLPYGIFTAVLNNVLFLFFNSSSLVYALVGVVCAVVFALCVKGGYTEKFSSMMFSSFLIAFCSAAASIPLNLIFYDGYSGNMWGDALFDMLRWYGVNKILAAAAGETVIDVLDKQICLLICGLLFHSMRRMQGGANKTGGTDKTDSTDKADSTDQKTGESKKGGNAGAATLVLLAILAAGAVMPGICASAAESSREKAYNARIFDNQNGMLSSEANVISETEDGYIWIGSYAGLTRYNGTSFEFIKESGIANVTAMICDSAGRLWVGTNDSGIARYENGVFTFFRTENGLPSNSIRCFCEGSGGEMYVGTTDRLCVFREDDEIEISDADVFFTMTMAFCDDYLVCAGNNGRIHILDKLGGCTSVGDGEQFFSCVCVTDSGVIAATDDGNIYDLGFDGSIRKKLSVPLHNIRCAMENSEGKIWLCADNGLGFISGGKYYAKDVKDFAVSLVNIHEDYQGNIWVASSRCGVLCLSPTSFCNLFDEYGTDAGVCNAVVRYGNGYCVGTDSGLVMLGTSGARGEKELAEMLEGSRVRSIMTDSGGDLWICSYGENGLVHMTGQGVITSYNTSDDPLVPNDRARCIAELSNRTFAVGTADGIYFIRDGKVAGNITREDGLLNSQILTLTEGDDGVLYAGSDGAGIFMIRDGQIIGNYTIADGLSSNVILRITKYKEGLLIVTSNSLNLLSEGKITVLTEFPYYNNYDVLIDGDTAYVLSSAGIFIANADEICANGEYAYLLINVHQGLESAITANSWNFIGDDGAVYLCCASGVFRYTPGAEGEGQNYKYGLLKVVCDGNRIKPENGTYTLPKDTLNVTIEGVVCNYSLRTPMVRFYEEGGADSGVVPYSEIAPIRINRPASGEHVIHFQLFDSTGKNLISENVFTVMKEQQVWEKPWYRAYLVVMCVEIIIFIVWTLVLIIDDRRKRKDLLDFNVRLESKVAEQTGMIREQSAQNERLLLQTVLALANTVDAKDNYTSGHSKRVAEYARMIAQRMGKSEAEQEEIYRAGLLHDVGKIRIPENIINKPGKLDDNEFAMIKLHPVTGYHILKGVASEKIFADGARFHHERYDGKGYPNGLTGKQIPEIARIIGVADAYDAMASRRSYRDVMPQEAVRNEIAQCSGKQFDPDIAAVMLQLIDEDKEYKMKETNPGLKKILAVDDERVNIKFITHALKDIEHYAVTGAESGEEALEKLRDGEYDVALIDIKMPEMDGYETLVKLREFSDIPVVFMTVDQSAVIQDELKKYNVTDFITKPFMPSVLKEILHAVLSE